MCAIIDGSAKDAAGRTNMTKSGKKGKLNVFLYILAIFLFISGLAVILYPKFTDNQYKAEVSDMKTWFEQQIAEEIERVQNENAENSESGNLTGGEDGNTNEDSTVLPYEDLYQELKYQNEILYKEKQKDLKDPFSYEQQSIDLESYGLRENIIGFISIPKMNVELPILLGANNENMKKGAVHLTETSYPIGGENTNCVLAAHRGYSRTAMFREIQKLEIGDEIYIQNFRETLIYKVAEIRIIDPTDIQELLIQEGRDMVTLLTCHPYRYNYQRYVVFCERYIV